VHEHRRAALPGSAIDPTPTDLSNHRGLAAVRFLAPASFGCSGETDLELAWIVRKKPIWSRS
jgi:hypothetical protein